MSSYSHLPEPSGLHAKMLHERRIRSPYSVDIDHSGRPGYVNVFHCELHVWQGHRDAMPAEYRGARDPFGVLYRPASD